MGLGKTLTMISLILKTYEAQKSQDEDSDTDDSFVDSNLNCINLLFTLQFTLSIKLFFNP